MSPLSMLPPFAYRKPAASVSLKDMQRLIGSQALYVTLYGYNTIERIELVKQGLPAKLLVTLASDMNIPFEQLCTWLGLPQAATNRKVKSGQALNSHESEGALAIARLVGQVEQVVAESGEPKGFNGAFWLAVWLDRPNSALGGQSPGDFLDTGDGRMLVSDLVAQMQSSAYA